MYFLIAQTAGGIESISYGWVFAKMIAAMIIVITLAIISIKYLLPKLIKLRRNTASKIEILDFQPLEQRKSIYIVKLDDRKVALAVSENSIAKLCEWEKET